MAMKPSALTRTSSSLFFTAILLSPPGYADAPLAPPTRQTIWSLNRHFFAIMDPGKQITTIYRAGPNGQADKIWSMYGWFRVASLSDDGNHLVAGYDGINLLPVVYDRQQVMLYFFERGELINHITLDRLIRDFSKLRRTVSHYSWGIYLGIDQDGYYVIQTDEGRKIRFDIKKGEPILEKTPR
jgi:hypothetical protein